MHLMHLLALTLRRVLPAIATEHGKAGGFQRVLMMLTLLPYLGWLENVLDLPIATPRSR